MNVLYDLWRTKAKFEGNAFITFVDVLTREQDYGHENDDKSLWMLARWSFVRSGGEKRHVMPIRAIQIDMTSAFFSFGFDDDQLKDMDWSAGFPRKYFTIEASAMKVASRQQTEVEEEGDNACDGDGDEEDEDEESDIV